MKPHFPWQTRPQKNLCTPQNTKTRWISIKKKPGGCPARPPGFFFARIPGIYYTLPFMVNPVNFFDFYKITDLCLLLMPRVPVPVTRQLQHVSPIRRDTAIPEISTIGGYPWHIADTHKSNHTVPNHTIERYAYWPSGKLAHIRTAVNLGKARTADRPEVTGTGIRWGQNPE